MINTKPEEKMKCGMNKGVPSTKIFLRKPQYGIQYG